MVSARGVLGSEDMVSTATERRIDVNGVTLRVLEAGPMDGPLVVLAHGFPELAYSWRHQIPVLAAAGYHVLAPDQRGYGGSSRPAAVEDYDITALTGDLLGLIDQAGADRAAIVGHDWGAVVAWAMPLLHPDRVAAVAGLSVPPVPRPLRPPTEAFRRIFGENFFYILYFQEPGPADAEMAADPHRTMLRMFAGTTAPADEAAALRMLAPGPDGFIARLPEPERLPDWLSAPELDVYVREFTRTGFTGPLNWYRNFDRNWHIMASPDSRPESLRSLPPAAATTSVPSLFVGGSADPILAVMSLDRAAEVVTGPYRQILLDGAGHWIQQERPDQVNAALVEFLSELNWA